MVRKALHRLLFTAAVLYLGYYLSTQWGLVSERLAELAPPKVLSALFLATLMLGLKACYHVITIRRLGQGKHPLAPVLARAYASSQLVRYLPGKVLGLVYEVERLQPQVPGRRVVAANLIQSLNTIGLACGLISASVLFFFIGSLPLAVIALVLTLAGLIAVHQSMVSERALDWILRRFPRLADGERVPAVDARSSQFAALVLLLEWLPYFAFWWLLLPPGSSGIHDAILLGSCYAFASLAANFAVLVPSGLVLREAIFLWSGTQLGVPAADLIVLGLVARMMLTLGDGLLALFCIGLERVTLEPQA